MENYQAAESVHFGMGTSMAHKAYGPYVHEALKATEGEAQRLEELLSRFLPGSDIARVNGSAGIKREKITEEAFAVLFRAAEFSRICHGFFDVTIGPLVDLWDYKNAVCAPPEAKIKQMLSLVDHSCLTLDPKDLTAMLKKPGQSIDLGGIGKGYASDRFMEVFRRYGVTSAYSNIGGNVSTLGAKPDGSPWRVGIRHPRNEGSLIGAVCVSGQAVVTSGDYERYFVDRDGKRFHHILNPVTGCPAESGLISVTVVAESAMTADALSTALFVAGMDRGLPLLEKFPGAEAALVDSDLRVYVTRGLKRHFQAAAGIEAIVLDGLTEMKV